MPVMAPPVLPQIATTSPWKDNVILVVNPKCCQVSYQVRMIEISGIFQVFLLQKKRLCVVEEELFDSDYSFLSRSLWWSADDNSAGF